LDVEHKLGISNAINRVHDKISRARPRVRERRHVVIQSLFPSDSGEVPPTTEIEAYVQRLRELKEAGAQIPLVQIYSATRPAAHSECGHLPLRTLSAIAQRLREATGLKAEVF